MKKILVLGAGGKIARLVVEALANNDEIEMTLFVRTRDKIKGDLPKNARVVEGDALQVEQLKEAMPGHDIVYVNLSGTNIDAQVTNVVAAMLAAGLRQIIFVASLGIYDEVPGKFGAWNNHRISAYLPPFRRAADAIEASGMDYAILRAAWLTNYDEVDYETTEKGETFKGTEVSRKSVADLIVKLIHAPMSGLRINVGVNKPNTDGDKPAFL